MTLVASVQPAEVLANVEAALALVVAEAEAAQAAGAALVCFPECYLQGYVVTPEHISDQALALDSEAFRACLARLEHLEILAVLGMIERSAERFYNTAVVIRSGELLGRYRKVNLLPGEARCFSAGSDHPVFDVDGLRFGINICFDLKFEAGARRLADAGAHLMVCPCNNMLREETAVAWKDRHNAIRAERCRETSLWLLSSDVTGERDGRVSFGPTALLDPDGRVCHQVAPGEAGRIVCDLATRRDVTHA